MTPPSENLIEPDVFKLLLELETRKALRLRYPVSLLCVTPDQPLEGADVDLMRKAARAALSQVRATDVVAILSRSTLAILLVDAEIPELQDILRRIVEPMSVGATVSERRTWSAGGSSYPHSGTTGDALLRLASDLMAKAKREGGDRLYLPSSP
jgi:GGDEF domain-containing protein